MNSKYPQLPFPYDALVSVNRQRKLTDSHAFEYELIDTGIFADNRYFDVQVEYAKVDPQDILIRIQVTNRGPDAAPLVLLPTLWFRNTWTWCENAPRPGLEGRSASGPNGVATVAAQADGMTPMTLYCLGSDELLFVENESNAARLWGSKSSPRYPKDGINDYIVMKKDSVNRALSGTKASAAYHLQMAPWQTTEIKLRLSSNSALSDPFGADFDSTLTTRIAEAEEFYKAIGPANLNDEERAIQRQAYAGMLWTKQFYHYIVADWLKGDPTQPPPPAGRSRNRDWTHFYASDVLSMPDAWEYPWFAAWDLCFQSVVLSRLDPQFAKNQLLILAREWYISPAGAVPAYEWAFGDVNPPLHAWAALRIYEIDKEMSGGPGDAEFLVAIFQYCLTYFTWWSNRKDTDDQDLFSGGFLGLDNISVINRSNLGSIEAELGRSVELYQSDGTSWMGMFCLNMLEIAVELSQLGRPEYDRMASKFFQHFVFIADAMNSIEHRSEGAVKLWDEEDGFYYDVLKVGGGYGQGDQYYSIKLRSVVGLIATFPVLKLDLHNMEDKLSAEIRERIDWFTARHPEIFGQSTSMGAAHESMLLYFVSPDRLKGILARALDPDEFLGAHGIRSLSRAHLDPPYSLPIQVGDRRTVLTEQYEPAESSDGAFGGNSNWRGPIWFPVNFLFIETLNRYHDYLGDGFTVEYPRGSGVQKNLREVADGLTKRLISIFEPDADGNRPVYGGVETFQKDPNWRNFVLFYEYFHGDNSAGIGASHQTGWTGLVAELLRGL